jgi:hypothetical protein
MTDPPCVPSTTKLPVSIMWCNVVLIRLVASWLPDYCILSNVTEYGAEISQLTIYILITIITKDINHRSVLCLKYVSETVFCLRLEVVPRSGDKHKFCLRGT